MDVDSITEEPLDKGQNGRIERVSDGVFHVDGRLDDTDPEEQDGWLHLDPENPDEKNRFPQRSFLKIEQKRLVRKAETIDMLQINFSKLVLGNTPTLIHSESA